MANKKDQSSHGALPNLERDRPGEFCNDLSKPLFLATDARGYERDGARRLALAPDPSPSTANGTAASGRIS